MFTSGNRHHTTQTVLLSASAQTFIISSDRHSAGSIRGSIWGSPRAASPGLSPVWASSSLTGTGVLAETARSGCTGVRLSGVSATSCAFLHVDVYRLERQLDCAGFHCYLWGLSSSLPTQVCLISVPTFQSYMLYSLSLLESGKLNFFSVRHC